MPKLHPADELADLRTEIARLRLRETQLRRAILAAPDLCAGGRFARAEATLHCDHVLDPSLLPPEIRDDPRFYRTRHRWSIHCLTAARPAGPRPGWPIRREASTPLH